MDTNVQALKNLYEQLGGDPADVADITTNADMINAIAGLDIGGGGGTVDQTFNPASTNAQSGVAVQEALAGHLTFAQIGTCVVPDGGRSVSLTHSDLTDYDFVLVFVRTAVCNSSKLFPVTGLRDSSEIYFPLYNYPVYSDYTVVQSLKVTLVKSGASTVLSIDSDANFYYTEVFLYGIKINTN